MSFSLFITTLIFGAGIILAFYAVKYAQNIKPLHFGVSIATMISGLFIIMSRKKIITHIAGYIMMENGIFLLTLSVAKEMPFVVNLGVLLDLFAAVFMLGIFASKINSVFKEMYIDNLSNLKD